jgi:hypothetical protein
MAGITKPIEGQELTDRQAGIVRALASVRMERIEPTEAAKSVFDRYVEGGMESTVFVSTISTSSASFGGRTLGQC